MEEVLIEIGAGLLGVVAFGVAVYYANRWLSVARNQLYSKISNWAKVHPSVKNVLISVVVHNHKARTYMINGKRYFQIRLFGQTSTGQEIEVKLKPVETHGVYTSEQLIEMGLMSEQELYGSKLAEKSGEGQMKVNAEKTREFFDERKLSTLRG